MCACQVPSVSNITSLQEFLMDTGKLKTFTHLSVFTPRKRSSWAIYLVVQFAVGSVFFGFQVIRTSSTQPTRRSPLILMLCSSQRSYLWGRLMRIIMLHNIKRNHSYLILNMLRRANYFLDIVLFLHVFLIPQVKLKMNYHGCVDTLQEECKRWFDKHARDGTNKTARARWGKRSLNNYLVKISMRTTVKRNYKREMVKNTLKVWYLTKSSFRPHLTQSNHP